MAAVRTKKRALAAVDRLINRELSFLDYDARVLALAADDEPAAARARPVLRDLLDDARRVLHGAHRGPHEPGGRRASPCARPTAARRTRRSPRRAAACSTCTRSRRGSGRGSSAPRSPPRASSSRASTISTGAETAELERRYEDEIYPVLTPLAVGPGQPFPYISALSVSVAVFARDPETGEERFARVKVPEGLPRFLAVGDDGRARSARAGADALPAVALPRAWRSSSARSSGSRATPTSRSRTRPTTCSRRSRSSFAAGASAR